MASSTPFPYHPKSNARFPPTALAPAALEYIRKDTSPTTVNHCLRSAYFALMLSRKLPPFVANPANLGTVVLAVLLHDMGWATDESLLSVDKRFEIDGANLAREYLRTHTSDVEWDNQRLHLVWDAIALHTTPSIAAHKEPEVALTQLGIFVDFVGPNFPGGAISVDEYTEVVNAFPRMRFKDETVQIMCGLCKSKPATTFDNFVSAFGIKFGLDGKGENREEFAAKHARNNLTDFLLGGQDACTQ